MSRHKLVKALDLDEELDDFDGNHDDDYQEQDGMYMSLASTSPG